jgi:glyoxylase I family protein
VGFLKHIHHVAIICSDYQRSKQFYTQVLGLSIDNETYRAERGSYKLDLSLNGTYIIELFSFPDPPPRLSRPEATGLRHLAFGVTALEKTLELLQAKHISFEPVRIDEHTGKKFTFIFDPDELPIELYEL